MPWKWLDPRLEEQLRARARRRSYPRGVRLFSEGDTSDWVVVLEAGRVKASVATPEGREILLAVRGTGALLGELSAIDGAPRSATVTAVEPVEALVIDGADFRAFLATEADAAFGLLQLLTRRLRDADRKRIEFGASDTVGRVASRLVELIDRFGEAGEGRVRIGLPLSQEELAGWVGSSREAVSKALLFLRRHGWIETGRKEIVVLDLDALRRRSG